MGECGGEVWWVLKALRDQEEPRESRSDVENCADARAASGVPPAGQTDVRMILTGLRVVVARRSAARAGVEVRTDAGAGEQRCQGRTGRGNRKTHFAILLFQSALGSGR